MSIVSSALNYNPGSYVFNTIIHELGHALGLAHPGPYNGSANHATQTDYWNDSTQYTVMSYYGESYTGGSFSNPGTPLLDDILALQMEYGANWSTRTGDTTYGFNNTSGLDVYDLSTHVHQGFAVWDAGGHDTLDFSGSTTGTVLDLRQGGFSSVDGQTYNVSIAYGVVVEDGVGSSSADLMRGNEVSNVLSGGDGNDTIYGGDLTQPVVAVNPADFIGIQMNEDPLVRNQYMSVSGITAFSGDSFTFEEMVKITRVPANAIEFASYNVSGNDNQFILEGADSGYLQVTIANKATYVSDISTERLVDGNPHRLSLTWDKTTGAIGIYIDGALAHSGTYTAAIGATVKSGGTLVFGQEQDSVGGGFDIKQVFQGTMGDIRLFGSALGASTIAGNAFTTLTGTETGLAHNWQVQTGDTTTVTDVAGHTNLTVYNGATVHDTTTIVATASDDDTLYGGAGADTLYGGWGNDTLYGDLATGTPPQGGVIPLVHLNGSFDAAAQGGGYNDQSLDQTQAFPMPTTQVTFEMEMQLDATPRYYSTLLAYSTGGEWDTQQFSLQADAYGTRWNLSIAGVSVRTGIQLSDFVSNTPFRLSVSWDSASGAYNIYRDGTLLEHGTIAQGASLAANGNLWIASGWDSTIRGSFGDIRVWNTVRTADEIYNDAYAPLAAPASEGHLVANWQVGSTSTLLNTSSNSGVSSLVVQHVTADNPLVVTSVDFTHLNDDTLYGGDGNDVLCGGAGNDTLDGGAGFNTADWSDASGDVTFVLGSNGSGTFSNITTGTDTYSGIEGVIFGAGNDHITGNDSNNLLSGGVGNDILIGGAGDDQLNGDDGNDSLDGGVGADTMTGGGGNDIYYVDDAHDVVQEFSAFGGVDTVYSLVSWVLGNYVENLTLLGNLAVNGIGNTLANLLVGNDADNTLTGGSGDDQLNGGDGNDQLDGGEGADTLYGGNGDDAYYVDNAGDQTIEDSSNGGVDTVYASVSWTLGDYLENLTLVGDAVSAAGNGLANVLVGNGAANVLNGGDGNDRLDGGGGADTLYGGNGDDAYYVDNAGDQTIEDSSNGGVDTVYASVSRTLGNYLENLTLTGSAAINGVGNGLANVLVGNGAANVLNGGVGADRMYGGNGNDIYYVDNAGDQTVESSASGGVDTVYSSVSRTLGNYLENLTLTGSAAINGVGNGLANVLVGNGAANVLNGGAGNDTLSGGSGNDRLIGGAGRDIMTGGAGYDYFDFNSTNETTNGSSNCDVIRDFQHGVDHIDLRDIDASTLLGGNNAFVWRGTAGFTNSSAGELRYVQYNNAGTANDYTIIYGDTDNDQASEFQIKLMGLVTLAASDFML